MTENSDSEYLITSREDIFEELTSILDYLKTQSSTPNITGINVRVGIAKEREAQFRKIHSQILKHNSAVSDTKQKIPVKKEREAIINLFTTILELSSNILDQTSTFGDTSSVSRLPRLELPKFSGNFKDWSSFKELYTSLIHNQPISVIEKFQRLKGCLQGEPLKLISHYSLTSDNYLLAFQTLCSRYENPRIAANLCLNQLIDFQKLANDSHSSLQRFLSHHWDSVNSYKGLDVPDHYDYLLFQLCYSHLDPKTQNAFDVKYPVDSFPTYKDLINFVQMRLRTLEMHAWSNERVKSLPVVKHNFNITQQSERRNQNTIIVQCPRCTNRHPLMSCPQFVRLSIKARYAFVKENNLCFNCLQGHMLKSCPSVKKCKICQRQHHTLLHFEGGDQAASDSEDTPTPTANTTITEEGDVTALPALQSPQVLTVKSNSVKSVLLGTAQGFIATSDAKSVTPVRILLDPGSQVSCVTQTLVKQLRLKVKSKPTLIKGVTGASVESPGTTECIVYNNSKCEKGRNFNLLVLPTIPANLPQTTIANHIRTKFQNYKLADPDFDKPGHIDVLIGADYYFDVVLNKRILRGHPNGIHTIFGLALIGEISQVQNSCISQVCVLTLDELSATLSKFWETEEVPNPVLSTDDECETQFQNTVQRNPDGRYIVALPFNCDNPDQQLGTNRDNALQRLLSMERRFLRNDDLRKEYVAFMDEYLSLGHMRVATNEASYIIPHHAVFKVSTSTKLRVVFDASNVSNTGVSLNHVLRKGPKLQQDIFLTLSGFRQYKVALVSDIKMMYRQILVRNEDKQYQRILWRTNPTDAPQEFELNTVTYGLSCSPFLAQRVLKQLVADEGKNFPLASQALTYQTYVDDIVSGGSSREEAIQLYLELTKLLGRGGFFPRKWASSSREVLDRIPMDHQSTPIQFHENEEPRFKVLGLHWDPPSDSFLYHIEEFQEVPTKRTILSYIARMFDPMGWLTPFIFRCKYFMQQLWLEGLTWDDPVPPNLHQQWTDIISNVQQLSKIRIPRHIPILESQEIRLIGFCDASERGFAAVLFLRCIVENAVSCHLLGAKSKVAPLKPLSIPRLELNAAHLLTKLYTSFAPFLKQFPLLSVHFFSDSQIVLGWLKTAPHKLKTYVCNRVVDILDKTSPNVWHHVSSEENIADCASRGLNPQDLVDHPLWWKGCEFLYSTAWEPNLSTFTPVELPELKSVDPIVVNTATYVTQPNSQLQNFEKFSSLTKLNRVFAYALRFITRTRKLPCSTGPLKINELKTALERYICLDQNHFFSKEKSLLLSGSSIFNLNSLSPFLDQNGILRVGGRLNHAPLPFNMKHPILISPHSHLARLLIEYYHKVTLHGGPRVTRYALQQQFWIPKIGNVIKSILSQCSICRRHTAKPISPIMADLPPTRFDQVRPFLRVGTDFAGPFLVKESLRRKSPLFKAYLCLFVCFSTKAVHLEVVSSLATKSFLAAVDRFVARRGLCSFLHSDNGTNFVGAARQLSDIEKFLRQNADAIEESLSIRHIQWLFNPPAAPHFGGLWEAAVKSFKYHLNRITKSHTFTLEEFNTLSCRIEAILNSRPLSPLTSTPTDENYILTPGHFLIGAPLISIPEIPLRDVNLNHLSRWQLVTQATQNFWKTWRTSYLHMLLPRHKWKGNEDSVNVGDVVFIRQINTPPLLWPIAKVEETLAGKDGVSRIAKLKCHDRILTRPVRSLVKVFV